MEKKLFNGIKQIATALLALSMTLLGGCFAPEVPDCSAKEVLSLLNKTIAESYLGLKRDVSQHETSIDLIRTRDTNSQTGARECAATLLIKNPKNQKEARVDFTYLIERLDKSSNTIHVETKNLKSGISDILFFQRVDDRIKAGPSKGF